MPAQYPNAVRAIRDFIIRKSLTSGASLPSTRALATELGFSHHALSHACNILISGGILSRKGYKMKVRSELSGTPAIHGVVEIVSYIENFSQVAARTLADCGIACRITDLSWSRHPNMETILRDIISAKPSGVLLWIAQTPKWLDSLLQANETPMVVCAQGSGSLNRSSVQADNYRGAEKAIRYLYDLGHRRLAHVSSAGEVPDQELAESYRTACLQLDLKSSASMIWRAETPDDDEMREVLLAGRRRHPEVTAVFGGIRAGFNATQIFDVPRELSVVISGSSRDGLDTHPPLTAVAVADPDCIARWACMEIASQLRTIQSERPRKPPTHALFVPDLILRESARALFTNNAVAEIPQKPPALPPQPDTWQKIYPFLKKKRSPNWLQLDLSRRANHSMRRQHGWLGAEPLEHFPSGLRSIHGVPFQILDEDHNQGRSVVTFRSPHSHFAGTKQLPATARLKVNSSAKALYFLHGCAFAQPLPFAHYIIHYREGVPVSQPLIPLGFSRTRAEKRLGRLKPNLQDWWWPDFEPVDFPHAYHALVVNPADPTAYKRSLYSLEWINPQPRDPILSIEIRVDPDAGPAFALIAVTALLEK